MRGQLISGVCAAVLGVQAVSALARKASAERRSGSISDQLQTLAGAFSEQSYKDQFTSAFAEALSGSAKDAVPAKDTANSEGSLMYEKALRSRMLQETTRLLHALEVAKQIEVLNYAGAPVERAFDAAAAEETARRMVTQLAESLVRTGSSFGAWVPGMATVYSKFVAGVVGGVELPMPASADDLSGAIGRLAASVGVLLSTIVERGVYTAGQIREAFVASKMDVFFSELGVSIDLA